MQPMDSAQRAAALFSLQPPLLCLERPSAMSLQLLQLPTVCMQLVLHFCKIPDLLKFARCSRRCVTIVNDPFAWACAPPLQIDSVTFDSSAPIRELLQRSWLRHVGLSVRWIAPSPNSGLDRSNLSALASVARLIAMPRIRALVVSNGSMTATKEPHPNWPALLLESDGPEPLPALAGIQRLEVDQSSDPVSGLQAQFSSLFQSDELIAALVRSMPRLHTLSLSPSRFDPRIPSSLLLPLAASASLTALSFAAPYNNSSPLLRSLLELRLLQKLHLEVRMIETLTEPFSQSDSEPPLEPWLALRHVRVSASGQSVSQSRVTLAMDAMCRLMPSLESLQLHGNPECAAWMLPLRAHCPAFRRLIVHVTRIRLQLQPLLASDHTPLLLAQLSDLLLVSSSKGATPLIYTEMIRKLFALGPQKVRRVDALPEAFQF